MKSLKTSRVASNLTLNPFFAAVILLAAVILGLFMPWYQVSITQEVSSTTRYTSTYAVTRTTNETQAVYTLPNPVSLPANPAVTGSGKQSCPGVPPNQVPPDVPGMIYTLYGYCNPNEY